MTVEDVDWGEIYKKTSFKKAQKFERLIKPPPFCDNFDVNVHIGVEWLFRNGKRSIDITRKEPYLNLVKDHWYEKFPEGTYLHVCFPVEMIKFQHQYATLFDEYLNIAKESFSMLDIERLQKGMKSTLWSAWKCTGWDGEMVWSEDKKEEHSIPTTPGPSIFLYDEVAEMDHSYQNKCSRCMGPMPRALAMFNKLQYGPLKGLKDVC